MSGENPRDGNQNDDHRDDQDDNNNRDRNHRRVWRYAYGSIGLEGIAMEWFRQRQKRLARLRFIWLCLVILGVVLIQSF